MTRRIRKIPIEIPGTHSFARFLSTLPMDDACDPYPDIIERAVGERYFIGFMGDNCNARQTRFIDFIKSPLDTGAQLLTQHFGGQSCRAVIYLTRFTPVIGSSRVVRDEDDGSCWLALPAPRSPEKIEDENCTLMPTY